MLPFTSTGRPSQTSLSIRPTRRLSLAFLVHLKEEEVRDLADIGLIGDALIAQHVREIPDLGDDALGVHAALSRNGLMMASPPKVRPCCMSSL
jgi:hypothetical protein